MRIYLATGNLNKKREMQELFPEHTIVIPSDEGISFAPDETGTTFYENSLIKARALYELVRCPVIADDSGICVDALGGAPGIYSSRYAGPDHPHGLPDGTKIPQKQQNIFLLQQLNDVITSGLQPDAPYLHGPRSAHYTCAMVLCCGGDRLFVAQETFEGALVPDISARRGNGGFGYDPIFFVPEENRTAAELSPEEKNSISHRGKAVRTIRKIIENF